MKMIFFRAVSVFMALFLTACGGGGTLSQDSGGGSTTPDPVTYSISLTLQDATTSEQVSSSTPLSATKPLNVLAHVTASDGSSLSGQVISFSFDESGLADFSVQNGRVALDSNGDASIGLVVGQSSGAGNVIATFSDVSKTIAFTSAGQDQSSVQPASLNVYASSLQLPSSGSDQIKITALVKDANNSLMQGVTVRFSVDSGNLLGGNEVTDDSGSASVLVNTEGDHSNRIITVTATVGSVNPIQKVVTLQVEGTEVLINAPSSVILNDTAQITISVQDSDGNPVGNQPVVLTSQLGTLSDANPTTSASGVVTVTYTATQSGRDTITASALNASTAKPVVIGEDSFSFTSVPGAEVPLGQNQTLTVTWLKDGVAYANGNISFFSSRGTIVSSDSMTNAQGQASITLNSNSAGFASVTAVGTDAQNNEVSARTQVEFVAQTATEIVVDATPDSIGPDGQEATITAVVRDASRNLVKGVQVEFVLDDVSGGNLSPAIVTTDSNGTASTVYTSVGTSSINGVKVTATVVNFPAVHATAQLTVSDRAFDISFGASSNLIVPESSPIYRKEFAVFVSDSSGNPVRNVSLSASLQPVRQSVDVTFFKGFTQFNSVDNIWEYFQTASCVSEDADGDGTLDVGEDTNNDGELSPGIIGVIYFKDNDNTTDDSGQVTLVYDYPQSYAVWAQMKISVLTISTGTESAASTVYRLQIASVDIQNKNKKAPDSPWGIGNSCSDLL